MARLKVRVVFAESCTAGLVAASLARVPGISEHLCGSAVTYRNDTKARWLGVPERLLKRPGPVSESVARLMAKGILERTPEADLAASVTGHLGPDAPHGLDGVVYIAIAARDRSKSSRGLPRILAVTCEQLTTSRRTARQREAASLVLQRLCDVLEQRETR